MKTTKALKRLAKIKSMISDVAKRYSASAPHLKDVLKYAEDAVARAKDAVGLHAKSRTKAPTAKTGRAVKRVAPARKKASVKARARTSSKSKTAKKSTPIKRTAKKRSAKKMASALAVQAATEAFPQ
jgi:hypothetical protein